MGNTMEKANGLSRVIARLSIKRLIQAALLSAVLILLTIFTFVVRERYIHAHCSSLLEKSRLVQAHFAELSEYITEQLLTDQIINMVQVEHEAEIIGEKSFDIAQHPLVRDEFKLLLVGRNDLTKLMARIRLLSTQSDLTENHLTIYRMLHELNSRLVTFGDGFSRYVWQQWQTVQNLLRGFLAIATVFLTALLFLLHAYVILPFFQMVKGLRKDLGRNTEKREIIDSVLSMADLGDEVRRELTTCMLYKHFLRTAPDLDCTGNQQGLPAGSVWKMVAPLLEQYPDYKRVLTSFFSEDGFTRVIPDYLLKEVQNRGVVIFRERDSLSFPLVRKIAPYSGEIHAGVCLSIVADSGLSGMVTILSDNTESFTDQEVAALSTFLRFLEYIDSSIYSKKYGKVEFSLEELRAISLTLLNERPPYREFHKIIDKANGIINCAQILQDQITVELQEDENRKLLIDLWKSGKKIADRVIHLRALHQVHSTPVNSTEDAIALLVSWLELQFPEVSQILHQKSVPHLPPVQIPGRDLFLALALLAEQVIPEPGSDYGSCIVTRLHIEAHAQTETEVIIKLVLQPEPVKSPGTTRPDTTPHMRQLICNALLHCHGSALEVSRAKDQTLVYRFLLR